VPVWIDAEHAAAHNKVMVIDNGTADAAVITGSFNFTQAAQHRNAENLLILRGNPPWPRPMPPTGAGTKSIPCRWAT
jgi:phosphatidylserine/phosphatidylglycerophosphate/cardiolipin synthase-like enzyme